MSRRRRVTLRCICDDLHSEWNDPAHATAAAAVREAVNSHIRGEVQIAHVASKLRQMPPLTSLRHPIIEAFDTQFAGDDDGGTLRESISSVSDRQWLKQRNTRWRGAAVVLKTGPVETAWLGAAGYHRAGSPEDFYNTFAKECAVNSDGFLPMLEDEKLLEIDRAVMERDAWVAQVHLSTLVLLANALDTNAAGPLIIVQPSSPNDQLLRLTISIERIDVDGLVVTEANLTVEPTSHKANLVALATRTILGSIEPDSEKWRTAPLSNADMSYGLLLSSDSAARAFAARDSGELAANDIPGQIRVGTVAHFTRIAGLTAATVTGEPVQAMCGHWFVPMHDHEHLPVCATCVDERQMLRE